MRIPGLRFNPQDSFDHFYCADVIGRGPNGAGQAEQKSTHLAKLSILGCQQLHEKLRAHGDCLFRLDNPFEFPGELGLVFRIAHLQSVPVNLQVGVSVRNQGQETKDVQRIGMVAPHQLQEKRHGVGSSLIDRSLMPDIAVQLPQRVLALLLAAGSQHAERRREISGRALAMVDL